jgi:hypothetical protein
MTSYSTNTTRPSLVNRLFGRLSRNRVTPVTTQFYSSALVPQFYGGGYGGYGNWGDWYGVAPASAALMPPFYGGGYGGYGTWYGVVPASATLMPHFYGGGYGGYGDWGDWFWY